MYLHSSSNPSLYSYSRCNSAYTEYKVPTVQELSHMAATMYFLYSGKFAVFIVKTLCTTSF